MSVMIQVRDVPEELQRKLRARADEAGLSLSEFLRREVEDRSKKLPLKEWLELVRTREPTNPGISAAEIIRQERDSR